MHKLNRKYINIVGLLLLLLSVFLIARFSSLDTRKIIEIVRSAHLRYLLFAICVFGLTYILGAGSYLVLIVRKTKVFPVLLIQLSGGFANKLIPGGLGSASVMTYYLRSKGLSMPSATAAVSLNALIGMICAAVMIVILAPLALSSDSLVLPNFITIQKLGIFLAFILALSFLTLTNKAARNFLRNYLDSLKKYEKSRKRIIESLAFNLLISICNGIVMILAAKSIDVTLSPSFALLAMFAGTFAASVTPTPGGIGGAEAAIAGVIHAAGITDEAAIAIALLFRVVTYWLPLISGSISFILARKKNYI